MDASEAARTLRAIPSEKRAQASRDNGKKGGRPRELKTGSFSAKGRRGCIILSGHGTAVDMDGVEALAANIPEPQDRETFVRWAAETMYGETGVQNI